MQPHLEYAQSVWAPHLKKHIDRLESVQIRATKLADGLGTLDYADKKARTADSCLQGGPRRYDRGLQACSHIRPRYDNETLSTT